MKASALYNRTRRRHLWWSLTLSVTILVLLGLPSMALPESQPAPGGPVQPKAGSRVEVQSVSSDRDIDRRLSRIMTSTGWFEDIRVEVKDGVVFLDGRTASDEHRAWAENLAGRTRDVVAVVNRVKVTEGPAWDLTPAIDVMRNLVQRAVQAAPMIGLSLILLILSVAVAKIVATAVRRLLGDRLKPLITDIVSRTFALMTFLIGLYLVLDVAGLTRLAATIIGGTGIAGLVAGIAFRDILENFLASMLISSIKA